MGILERTIDSASWPTDAGGAGNIRIRVPKFAPEQKKLPLADLKVAEADLRPSEIQDLADFVPDIVKLAVGHELKFHLRIELTGKPPEDAVKKLNGLLEEVSKNLKLT
jgi:hypothetical protein